MMLLLDNPPPLERHIIQVIYCRLIMIINSLIQLPIHNSVKIRPSTMITTTHQLTIRQMRCCISNQVNWDNKILPNSTVHHIIKSSLAVMRLQLILHQLEKLTQKSKVRSPLLNLILVTSFRINHHLRKNLKILSKISANSKNSPKPKN